MSTSGLVKRDVVLRILAGHGVLIFAQDDGNLLLVSHACPDDPEIIWLGDQVPRKIIHGLSRRYHIAIAHFYNADDSTEPPPANADC